MTRLTLLALLTLLVAACDRNEAPNITVSPIRSSGVAASRPDTPITDASHRE